MRRYEMITDKKIPLLYVSDYHHRERKNLLHNCYTCMIHIIKNNKKKIIEINSQL